MAKRKGILGTKFLLAVTGIVAVSLAYFFGELDPKLFVVGVLGLAGAYDLANVYLTRFFAKEGGGKK